MLTKQNIHSEGRENLTLFCVQFFLCKYVSCGPTAVRWAHCPTFVGCYNFKNMTRKY